MRSRIAHPILSTLLLLTLAAVTALPAAAQEDEVTSNAAEARGDTYLFHVALVLAEKGGGEASSGDLPPGVRKALDDVREFLPYDRYRVVDSAIVRTNRNATVGMSGPDGVPYRAELFVMPLDEGGEKILDVRGFQLTQQAMPEAPPGDRGEAGGKARAPRVPAPPLTASFRMSPGETVIVGSSRLNGGDRALIALLTAVE